MKTIYIGGKLSRVLGVSGKFGGACDIEGEVICLTPLYGTQGHISRHRGRLPMRLNKSDARGAGAPIFDCDDHSPKIKCNCRSAYEYYSSWMGGNHVDHRLSDCIRRQNTRGLGVPRPQTWLATQTNPEQFLLPLRATTSTHRILTIRISLPNLLEDCLNYEQNYSRRSALECTIAPCLLS